MSLIATQNYDGGWSWIPGFESSMYITKEIMHGLGQLIEGGIIEVTADIKRMVQNGIDYIDKYYYKEYNVENKPKSLGYDQLYYLLVRSYFQSYKFSGLTEASHTYFSRRVRHKLHKSFRSGAGDCFRVKKRFRLYHAFYKEKIDSVLL